MQYQRIEYIIGADGKITERVIEGQGQACTALTQGIEERLGTIESQELLPEYSNPPYSSNNQLSENYLTHENEILGLNQQI